jgi:hypothetical protein
MIERLSLGEEASAVGEAGDVTLILKTMEDEELCLTVKDAEIGSPDSHCSLDTCAGEYATSTYSCKQKKRKKK